MKISRLVSIILALTFFGCSDDIQILEERIKAQKEYNITSTPTIFINDKKYEDKHDFKSFKKQIDKLL